MNSKTLGILLVCAIAAQAPALAGVVYEIEVTDHGQSTPRSESIEAAVEGRNLKMGISSGGRGKQGEMVFRGDSREMVVVDHEDRSYHVIDEASMRAIADQVGSVMSQMQEALKNVPEDQRKMVEKMMQQRMPQARPEKPKSELKNTGEKASKNGYPCVKYDVLRDGRKVRELWVTDWSNVEGGSEVVDAFEDMAGFFKELMDSIPDFGQGGSSGDPVFAHMKEIGGFPVVTKEFGEDGSLEGESTLRSARRQKLDPAAFEPPSGYKRLSMGPQ